MIALILGATGATGKDLTEQLLTDSDFSEVHIFVRRPLEINNSKLRIHVVDFNNPKEWKNEVKGDVAFSCLGTTLKAAGSKENQYKIDVDYQYNFAKSAKENGVKNFILVSAFGANPKSSIFYNKMKGELEQKIENLHFQAATFFKPGMLERKNTDRKAETISLKILSFANAVGLFKNHQPLATSDLAKAMIKASKMNTENLKKIELQEIRDFLTK